MTVEKAMRDFASKDPAMLAATFAGLAVSSLLVWWTVSYLTSPLRTIPGPFLAGWTNLWRFSLAQRGQYPFELKRLHDKYGPVVRLGPNMVDLDMPEMIKTVYTTDGKWSKTSFYHNNSALVNGQIIHNIFSTTDQATHARMKKPIAKFYSQSNVLSIEPLLDRVIDEFCTVLDERFTNGLKTGGPVDLGEYIAFVTWDMVGALTFSQPFGYLEKGHDFDNTIAIADKAIDYFSTVGQMPFLDFLLDKNPVVRLGPPNLGNITGVAIQRLGARLQDKDPNFNPEVPDYLQYFLDARQTHPEIVDDGMVLNYLLINLIAGADTTAIAMRATIYFLLRHPGTLERLEKEVLAEAIDGPFPYAKAKSLPYLDAVIREAMRLHPGVAMPLERYVPHTGLALPDGTFIPASTRVGLTPYIISRNKDIWGTDADTFRPERWLRAPGEDTATYQQRLRKYNASDLAFGAGSRICLGRHLSMVEAYKIVATLVNRYEMSLADPSKEWKIRGVWFFRQWDLICKLKKR